MLDFSSQDQALFYEIFISKEYDFLDDTINQSNKIVDIWWYIGFFSLYCFMIKSKYFYKYKDVSWKKINAFIRNMSQNFINQENFSVDIYEPVKSYILKSQKVLKHWKDNITFYNCGIGKYNWFESIYLNNIKPMQTSMYDSFLLDSTNSIKNIKIKKLERTSSLSSNIDLLKMDIEWGELDVLLNLKRKYFSKIRALAFEYHIINETFVAKLDKLIDRLSQIYPFKLHKPNSYSDRLGLYFFK